MKAVAVFPGKPDSIHLADLPEPHVGDIPDGRGVLVEVLRVGVDGTRRRREGQRARAAKHEPPAGRVRTRLRDVPNAHGRTAGTRALGGAIRPEEHHRLEGAGEALTPAIGAVRAVHKRSVRVA